MSDCRNLLRILSIAGNPVNANPSVRSNSSPQLGPRSLRVSPQRANIDYRLNAEHLPNLTRLSSKVPLTMALKTATATRSSTGHTSFIVLIFSDIEYLQYLYNHSSIPPMVPIKVVIADDHVLFREGLKRILSLETELLVVGEAANFAEAVSTTERMRPDVLLMDLKMPAGDTIETLIKLGKKCPATKVIILTAHADDENVLTTAKNRARGYLLKGISVPSLVQAIKKVHVSEISVDPELPAAGDFERIAKSLSLDIDPPANETLNGLTKREVEILQLVAEGLSNEEIGKRIFISPKTVKTHLTNIFDKLQVHNRFKAALLIRPLWK